jgi:hypothetical protein
LNEDGRHHSLRESPCSGEQSPLDRRLGLGGSSFFLRFDELLGLRTQPIDVLRNLADERQKERALPLRRRRSPQP